MPKLSMDMFLASHHNRGATLYFSFVAYARAQVIKRQTKNESVRVVKTGKPVPTPNAVVNKLASTHVRGDYTIDANGACQKLLLANKEEARTIARELGAKTSPVESDSYQLVVDEKRHLGMVEEYGL
jgi:hypothetical protein